MKIFYAHHDCPVGPSIEWTDTWSSAVDGVCPACGTKDIVPMDWEDEKERANVCMSSSLDEIKSVEVRACREVDEDEIETFAEEEATFWTVYIRKADNLAEAVADMPTRRAAEAFMIGIKDTMNELYGATS